MKHTKSPGRAVTVVAILSLILEPTAPLLAGAGVPAQAAPKPAAPTTQTPTTQTPTTQTPTTQTPPKTPAPAGKQVAPAAGAKASATAAPVDGGWPRFYDLPSGGTLLMYQPQISSWDKQKHLVAFSAVSYRTKAADKPTIGTIKLEGDTKVAVEDRLVNFSNMKITEANFQTLSKDQVREIASWRISTRARSCPSKPKASKPIRRRSSSARRPR
jgi:hypothetical protein